MVIVITIAILSCINKMKFLRFVMLRAVQKQTVVEYQGQTAKNDDYFTDSSESSDFYTVLCSELLNHYAQVEIWYQEDSKHKAFNAFVHKSGLVERFWPKGYLGLSDMDRPDILFIRGDKKDYHPVLKTFPDSFKIYYPAGNYYNPPSQFAWDLVFADDPRHAEEVRKETPYLVELFRKSCVDRCFPGGKGDGAVDIYFTCNAPQYELKGLRFFLRIMRDLKAVSALCVGLKDENMEKEFKGLPVYFTGFVPRRHVGELMARCRMGLILSTERDGSPRVLQEYICSDLPVVVRESTAHSPLYVNPMTGVASSDENMVKTILRVLESRGTFAPREYFMENLTIERSAAHIHDLIEECGGAFPVSQH